MSSVSVGRPCILRFTQCSVGNTFRSGVSLLETACALAEGHITVNDIEPIRIVYWDNHWWSLDNRRLAVFRILEFAGLIDLIPVLRVDVSWHEWRRKFCTDTDGAEAVVRRRGWRITESRASTSFPWELIEDEQFRRLQLAADPDCRWAGDRRCWWNHLDDFDTPTGDPCTRRSRRRRRRSSRRL